MAIAIGSIGTVTAVGVATATPSGAATAASCTDSWQGPTTGTTDWNASAANWSSGFPTSSGVTCVNLPGTYTVSLKAGLNLGTLQVGGGSSGKQTVQIDGSVTNVAVDLASPSLVANRGALVLAPSAGYTLLSGAGGVSVSSGGTLATSGATNTAYLRTSISDLSGSTVTIGTANTLQDQGTTTSNSGTFTVAAGGLLTLSGGGVFTNAGSLNLTGSMTVGSGTFNQSSGAITGNPVVMSGGGVLADSAGTGRFDLTGSTSLSGVIPSGQTVTVDGSVANVVLNLTSAVTDSGSLVLSGTAGYALLQGSDLTVASGGVLSTSGSGNTDYLRTNVTNQVGGTVTIGAPDTRQDQGTTTTNNGSFVATGAGAILATGGGGITNAGSINDAGAVTVGNSTFTQTSGSISGNPVVLTGGSTLTDTAGTGAIDITGSTTMTGNIPVGQTVTVLGTINNVIFSLSADATVSGVLNLDPSAGYVWLNGPGAVNVASGGVLASTGTANIVYLRTNITNKPGGTVTMAAADIRQDQGTTTTNNGSFVVASGGAFVASSGGGITNAGSITDTGALTVGNSTFTQTSGSISGNPVVLTGGSTLTDTAGTGPIDITGNTNLTGNIPVGQSVTVLGTINNVIFSLVANSTVNGVLNLAPSAGYVWLNGPGALTVASGGVLATAGTGNPVYLRTAITTQPGGTFTVATPDTRLDQGTTTTNGGTLQVQDGGQLALTSGSALVNSGILGTTVNATGPTTSGITGGVITAGGTFQVVTMGSPTIGTVFTPISGATLSGSFSNLEYGAHGYTTTVSGTGVSITATPLPFSVVSKTVNATAHQPVKYAVAGVTTLSGSPTYIATINWGDSTSSAGTVAAGVVKGTHSYVAPGPYVISVTVHASNGTTLSTSKSTTVKADPVPTVTSVTPDPVADGANSKVLTVNGTGFTDNAVATFSAAGITVVSATYVSPTKMSVKIDVAKTTPVGAGNVTITTPGGAGTCSGCLTVDPAPKITSISPVPAHGATTALTVTGSGFQGGLVVSSTIPGATFGSVSGQTATSFSIQITIPVSTAPGVYKLSVVNPDGGKVSKSITVS